MAIRFQINGMDISVPSANEISIEVDSIEELNSVISHISLKPQQQESTNSKMPSEHLPVESPHVNDSLDPDELRSRLFDIKGSSASRILLFMADSDKDYVTDDDIREFFGMDHDDNLRT